MNYALSLVSVLVQPVLAVRITGSGECTPLDLLLDVFSEVTHQQISDRARVELQLSGSFYEAFASRYYFLAFETHAEQILSLSMGTISGLKMPKPRISHREAVFITLISHCCTHNSH